MSEPPTMVWKVLKCRPDGRLQSCSARRGTALLYPVGRKLTHPSTPLFVFSSPEYAHAFIEVMQQPNWEVWQAEGWKVQSCPLRLLAQPRHTELAAFWGWHRAELANITTPAFLFSQLGPPPGTLICGALRLLAPHNRAS